MALKMRCQEVKKLVQSMPKGGAEEIHHQIATHLSECEACGRYFAGVQRIECGLQARKLQLDNIASRTQISRSRVFAEIAKIPPTKRAWFFRPAWAGAATFVLLVAGAVALLLNGRGIRSPGDLVTPMTSKMMPSGTLEELAEVLCRHEVPSPELPYAADAYTHEPLYPTSLQHVIEPEDTLTALAQTTLNLTRREET